ncbi:hypothetical protein PRUPE_1G465100 [Prunus persica]|uniref:Uncharacterized protein n=1 Tax=Prunus persica TaxID=3760 RepID=M5XMV4_PRUPE|nr:hypothetical protein PRUPE_1G465100 [Prunus persica]
MVLHISIRRCQRIFLVRSCGLLFLGAYIRVLPHCEYSILKLFVAETSFSELSYLPPCANLSICLLLIMSFKAHTPSTLFISSLNLLFKPVKL